MPLSVCLLKLPTELPVAPGDWLATACQLPVAREKGVFPDWVQVVAGSHCEINGNQSVP